VEERLSDDLFLSTLTNQFSLAFMLIILWCIAILQFYCECCIRMLFCNARNWRVRRRHFRWLLRGGCTWNRRRPHLDHKSSRWFPRHYYLWIFFTYRQSCYSRYVCSSDWHLYKTLLFF